MTVEGVEFVEIGPGIFRMGSNYGTGGSAFGKLCASQGLPWGDQPKSTYETPVHWVEFEDGFWIARTEVTNAQYAEFLNAVAASDPNSLFHASMDITRSGSSGGAGLNFQALRLGVP